MLPPMSGCCACIPDSRGVQRASIYPSQMNGIKGMKTQATHSMPAATLGILDECHDIVLKHLRPHIKKLFESSDLAFIEFAEKSQSSASQLRFFEAMTVIQKNRDNTEDIFYRELGRSFADFGCGSHHSQQTDYTEIDSLALISKEETDIRVAIQNMVAGTSLGSAQELVAVRQRLAVLNHGQQLAEKDIPGGPSCLANAFHEAAAGLLLEHQTRLIVYMLFNKFVLSKTTPLYDEYNKCLLKAGLLPNLKYQVRIDPARVQARTAPQAEAATGPVTQTDLPDTGNQSLGDELFGSIMQLLSRRDGQEQTNTSGQQQGVIHNPIPQTELVSALQQLQRSECTENPVVSGNTWAIKGVEENNQLIESLVENLSADRERLFAGIDRRRLPAADTQLIDLVGMMFEYMLNDKEIPSVAKVELSRLHTPYLKVAIIDKGVFTDTHHPAHELLNELANAAASWVVESNLERGIFPSIRNVVERITTDFESNIDIFGNLLELFRANVRDMENKSSAIEKRTQQAAQGKEKLGLARQHAAAALDKCMAGHNVPAPVRKLLNDVWQEKLMFIYLREPEAGESDCWKLAIEATKAIIWSVEPRTSLAAQTELRNRLPEVRKQIELTFETLAAYGNYDTSSHLALLWDVQEAILHKPVTESRDPEQPSQPVPEDPQLAETCHEEASDNAISTGPAEGQLTPEIQAAMSRLRKVAFGTWFSIQENEDVLPERVKLSWYSHMSGNYMFVDSMGMKSRIRKHAELATLMATGKASIIQAEQRPLVQRALQAIRRMLGNEERVPA